MTVYQMLQEFGLPVAYGHFTAPPSIPFLVYLGTGADNFKADSRVYYTRRRYEMQYYFESKNEKLEDEIEKHLTNYGCVWEKSEDIYIESEKLYFIRYTF